jgi:CHAT domain-containing protein
LTKQVRGWRAAILKRDAKAETELARSLYSALFSTLEKEKVFAAGSYQRLVLVGDGPLLDVPFAALLSGEDKRLVEVMPISVSTSFGVLLWPDDQEPAAVPILIAADPVASVGSPLPAARAEGRSIAELFPGARLFVGEAATRKQIQPILESSAILHFATHGLLDEEDGLKSGVLLANEKGNDEVPLLTADELINTHLAAQLVVLSACDTGQGQKSGGEGLVGLTWGFRAAGCPCTVASLWSVDDAATGQLMVNFYQGLKEGKKKDEALRDAMIAVKKTQSQPYYWAAFQMSGATKALKL